MEDSIYDYPAVDFSPLLEPGKLFAVRCESEEEARNLIAGMKIQFPEKIRSWSLSNTYWDNDNDGMDEGRAYFPDVNDAEHDRFLHGDVRYAKENGFEIVPFSALIQPEIPIEESDMSIKELLGWQS